MSTPSYLRDNPWAGKDGILAQRGKDTSDNPTVPQNALVKKPQKQTKNLQKPPLKQAKPSQNQTTSPTPPKEMYFGDLTTQNSITRLNKRLLKEVYTGTLDLDTARTMAYILQGQIRNLTLQKMQPPQITIAQQQNLLSASTTMVDSKLKELPQDEQQSICNALIKLGWTK